MGGLMFQYFQEQYTNPFIWSLILDDKQFVNFCKDYDKYIKEEVKLTNINNESKWCKDTNKKTFNDWEYPILDLSGIEIHWIHHTNQVEKLINSFEKRKQRYFLEDKPRNIFLFNYFTLFQEYILEEFENLLKEFLKHKNYAIILLPDDLPQYFYELSDERNIIVKMDGNKFNTSKRNPWYYNENDTPDKRYTFISYIEKIKNGNYFNI
jgi:hypothetical protein